MTVPPQNLEAEENVLGAMMMTAAAIEAVTEEVSAEDFYRESHAHIFRAAVDLHAKQLPVDVITIRDELDRKGLLAFAGGDARLKELAYIVPTSSNAGHYARIVAEQAGCRRLQAAGMQIAKIAGERHGELEEVIEQAEQALSEAMMLRKNGDFLSVANSALEELTPIFDAIREGKPLRGLNTGYADLESLIGGLQGGKLYLLAARPSMGKSTLALNIAENVSDSGSGVAFATLEMSRAELMLKQLSRLSGIGGDVIKSAELTDEQKESVRNGARKLQGRTNLHIDDSHGITTGSLRASARRLHRAGELGLLVIDYLQLMTASQTQDSYQREIATISRGLKLLAKELNVPILALSQLNRQVEQRQDKRPMLSDLRDSGALEQDADVVMFIYRDEYYNPESDALGVAEVNVAKNRMGATGQARLAFNTAKSTFTSLAKGVNG